MIIYPLHLTLGSSKKSVISVASCRLNDMEWSKKMGVVQILCGAILVVLAVVITVFILLQNSKKTGLNSVMGGGSDTYAAKNKLGMKDKKLSRVTTILAIVFAVVALVSYLII